MSRMDAKGAMDSCLTHDTHDTQDHRHFDTTHNETGGHEYSPKDMTNTTHNDNGACPTHDTHDQKDAKGAINVRPTRVTRDTQDGVLQCVAVCYTCVANVPHS